MINYKEAKKYLIPTLLDYGFSERKDKSCRSCRVFSNGSEVLLVKHNGSGVYDRYQNKTVSGDYGDTVGFIIRRKLNKLFHLTAEEFAIIEAEVARVSNLTAIQEVAYNGGISERQPFDMSRYTVDRLDLKNPPKIVQRFFEQRGINVGNLDPFKTSIGVLVSDKGLRQPLFYWQNVENQIVGAQYKYIKDNVCIKRFLFNTDRNNSLWMTPLEGKVGLFVTEDPLDAIAHYQLSPTANVAYCCTGGTSTKNQREMVRKLARTYDIPIILGNDNDLAGQLENYKLLAERELQYTINKADDTVRLCENGEEVVWSKDNLIQAIEGTMEWMSLSFELKVPQSKDWNDDLKAAQRSKQPQTVKTEISQPQVEQKDYSCGPKL